jgi:hypothetical protein
MMAFKAWIDNKDPQDISDWDLDWANRLVTGETLVSAVWTISKIPANDATNPLVMDNQFDQPTGLAKVWLSGGVVGIYNLTCHATTSGGREYDHTKILNVSEL